MEAGIKVNLHNRFDIEVRDAVTGELKNQATAYNIVLDALWTRVLARKTFMSAIHIGTGTGTLDPARTSLFTFLVGRNVTLDSTSFNVENMYRRVKIQLEPSEYVGSIISEVGVAYGTTSTNLCTHAMLTDSEGNPITIEKTSTDVVIIYATVFFTVSTLPSYVKLTGVIGTSVGTNQTLAYLINQSGTIESNIRIGSYADTEAVTLFDNVRGVELATKTVTQTTDAATKKILFPVRRFEVAEANGAIQELGIGGSFNVQLPNENYVGTNYTDVVLTGQDGVKTLWQLPSINVDSTSVVVKVNNVETAVTLINLPFYKLYRPSSNKGNDICFQSNTVFYYIISGTPNNIIKVEWTGTDWRQTQYLSCMHNSGYFSQIYACPYAFLYRAGDGKIEVKTIDTLEVKLTYEQNTSIAVIGFLSDTVGLISNKTAPTSANYNFRMVYTLDAGATWQITGNLVGTFSGANSQLVVPAKTKQVLFQGGSSGTNFNLYSYDLTARTISSLSVPTVTQRSLGGFSPDETLLVVYGITTGIDVFEEVEGVWTKTNIIPDTDSPATYDMGWFIDNDVFIAGNTSTNLFSLWNKISGVWVKLLVNTAQSNLFDMDISAGSTLYIYNRKSPDGKNIMCDATSNLAKYVPNSNYMIQFASAPLATDEIKVSYTVNGIHKTTNYVLDVSGYIQFG